MPFLARASPKKQKNGMSIGFLSFKTAFNASLMIVSHFLPTDIHVWVTWNHRLNNNKFIKSMPGTKLLAIPQRASFI